MIRMRPATMIATTMNTATLIIFLPRKARKRPIAMKMDPKMYL
jgi:hypothetical protein